LDPDASLIPPAIASFAGVPVVEFITQGAIFAEMMRGNFGQMMLVLGLPTDSWWMGKTVWTGLLKEQRYRDLLNSELGAVENGWTTRPQKLMKTIKDCQGLIDECMMSGCAG
jgi:hypothetical protein